MAGSSSSSPSLSVSLIRQISVDDHRISFMASPLRNLQPLKCPRCDSSNTKFCYYNNYSLSQPRHYCKGCKRYWTRGGTLRNVPVGGGCRKNKKIMKRRVPPSVDGGDRVDSSAVNQSPTSNCIESSVFYSTHPTHNHQLNFQQSSFNSTRVSDVNGFDYQSHQIHEINGDLNFSSSSTDPIFHRSPTFTASNSPTSLLVSNLRHPKSVTSSLNNLSSGSIPYNDLQIPNVNGISEKDVRNEGQDIIAVCNNFPVDQLINSCDFSSLSWNSFNIGSWFDPSNMGSSVLL